MILRQFYSIYRTEIDKNIHHALYEDNVSADLTTNLLFRTKKLNKIVTADLVCKEDCILAGTHIFKKVFRFLDIRSKVKFHYEEGKAIKKGAKVLTLTAPIATILRGERTALNYVQRMSGVATLTHQFVKLLKNNKSKILHTRKTTPNFRVFEILSVLIGGGDFHRFNLVSSVMIKDNHIDALGGIENALDLVHSKKLNEGEKHRFEVEIRSLDELKLLLDNCYGKVKIIMLDNFRIKDIPNAIKIIKKHKIKIELSGGITLKNFPKIQRNGIDFYSIGMLTHGYKSADFSLDIIK
jgi:nicotinate-nucleotide pyrophosphorylase (carboxylating)